MDEHHRTFGFIHLKSYLKPSSADLPEFNNFRQKFKQIRKRQSPVVNPVKKNAIGVPVQFNSQFTIPFVCLTKTKDVEPDKSDEFHETLRHYVHFKTKQSFSKIVGQIKYQRELPIFKFKEQIIKAVNDNTITIIAGK